MTMAANAGFGMPRNSGVNKTSVRKQETVGDWIGELGVGAGSEGR
jgi:hypothetical protein